MERGADAVSGVLSENFSPYSDTYANAFVDPCVTSTIAGLSDQEKKANRIANCTALAAARGLTYDFANATPTDDSDDYAPDYRSSPLGKNGGNPNLQPEESESFTFSVVAQPSFIPNLTLHADYYEIELNNVIASVTAQAAANTCVDGPTLNTSACSTIFREQAAHADPQNKAERSQAFMLGGNDTYGAFIQGSINYAKRKVRGMDFGARYFFDTESMIGRNWGSFDYSMNGSWLIEQTNFNNIDDPNDYTEYASTLWYPRVRLTSSLSWTPNDTWRVTWTADWQTAQDIAQYRDLVSNPDIYPAKYADTGNFMRNDLTVRWKAREDLTVRAGVTNIFDEAQAPWLGTTLYSNFDPYGRRFNIGLNYTPW